MSKNTNGTAHAIQQAEKGLVQEARGLASALSRAGTEIEGHTFAGLEGQDVFVAGHRFHVVGTLTRVTFDLRGEPVAHLDNVFQIAHDQEEGIPQMFYLGDGHRIHRECIGWTVQPVSGRPKGWQDAWFAAKKRAAKE